jgi:hypothetical protein
MWKLNPSSHKIRRMTKIVQSMHTLLGKAWTRRQFLPSRLRNLDAGFSSTALA